ncbi:MAG TPA: rhomboid family intramembrane serine protease [Micropruina sp.]|jgi:membrane associated rhomboid family serine protease|nr:rhomboid family intramembrane serine protease [Micropruina sp.]
MSSHTLSRRDSLVPARTAGIVIGAWTVLLWLIELVDQVTRGALEMLGIQSWNVASLPSVFVAPLIHDDWAHLAANTLPFAALGFLVLLGGWGRALWATVVIVVVSGLFAWLLSPPHTVTIGASGLVFGWLAYLLVRAVFTRNTAQIVIAVAVLVVYGSLLWGVLPTQPGVSWQAHLGGALGGALAARLLHGRDRASTLQG